MALFRTLAHSERMLTKVGQAGLLDKDSPIEMIDREIVILRTSARCGCAYEWGVHVKAFSAFVGLTQDQIRATTLSGATSDAWTGHQSLLIEMVDELVDSKTISNCLWSRADDSFTVEQIMELILLVGFYHSIAFLNNVLRTEQEPSTPKMCD
ncbi:MAG: 4-carboxymuconolactone decarboxylase [Oceanicoccus sp.]|jgi:4-carboxymuconolactone decarboxylase